MRISSSAFALLLLGALCLFGSPVQAQGNQAYSNANCEASFLSSCIYAETTTTEAATASPAPLPIIGVSLWEAGLFTSSFLMLWLVRRRRAS
jgi:hypothetical protein